MNDPLVSVIVPCFNQAKFLPEAVESLQAQTYSHWECLIINDGSTDDTAEVGAALAVKDSRVRLINQSNRGLAGARNRGLDEAGGRFIQFLDSDDVIKPCKLEKQVEAIGSVKSLTLAYCDYYRALDGDLDVEQQSYMSPIFLSEDPLVELAQCWETGLSIPCHCFLFDARYFTKYSIRFDEDLSNHEDWDCWMRIFTMKPTIHYVDAKLAVYRLHSQSMCTDYQKMRRGFLMAIKKQRSRFAGDDEMQKILEQKRRDVLLAYRYHSPFYAPRRFSKRIARVVLPKACIEFLRAARDMMMK